MILAFPESGTYKRRLGRNLSIKKILAHVMILNLKNTFEWVNKMGILMFGIPLGAYRDKKNHIVY